MKIQVTAKNVDTSVAFQDYVSSKIDLVLDKYVGTDIDGHVRIDKEHGRFRTLCSIRLATGMTLESTGEAGDAYASADIAVEHLEKRVRRYKRRLKNHHQGGREPAREQRIADYWVGLADDEAVEPAAPEAPVIIAETQRTIRELPVSDAVLQLDLTDEPFLIFRNAASGAVNVVYRRADGHIGWIDPGTGSGNSNGPTSAQPQSRP